MSLFGTSGATGATASTVANGIDVQTSLAGTPLQIVYGQNRVSGNLIWYGGFNAVAGSSNGGGKGGVTGTSGSYTYYASFIIGVCQGPVSGVDRVWASKTNSETLALANLGFIGGAFGQEPWSGLEMVSPGQVLGYSGVAYACAYNYDLGSSAELPNFNFEVNGILAGSNAPALFDANPSLVIADFLANPYYGAGLGYDYLGNFSTYQNYCQAQGLWISPVFDDSQDAASLLEDIATATNAAFVWSGGALSIIPYGDLPLSANGATYTPPQNPLVALDDDDFIHAANEDPVTVERSRPADQINALSLEYLNRNNAYNPDLVQATDEASIAAYGLVTQTPASAHYFCDPNAAQTSANLQLARAAIRNQFTFRLGWKYCWLDPMDIVAISDATLGLDQQWVRILSIDESDWSGSDGGVLTVKAEQYLYGTGQTALYNFAQGAGYQPNYNAAAPANFAPMFLEPTFALTAGALQVWMAVAGPAGRWGGADLWLSLDGVNYTKAASVTASARYGVLLTTLQAAAGGLDTIDGFAVDLTQSGGALVASPGLAAAQSNASLCWIDGEFLSYGTSTLIGASQYTLAMLNRGQYGTEAPSHDAGRPFVRCDDTLAQLTIQPGMIGQTIFVKILSKNAWGGGQPSLAEVPAYTYTVEGLAYTEPLAGITNLATAFSGGIETLSWNAVADTRAVQYEIRQGAAWDTAIFCGVTPATTYPVTGNGLYWVAAKFVAPAGYVVYGLASSVEITGGIIVRNLLASFDEAATGWSGACSGTAIVAGNLQLAGAGNILADTDMLAETNLLQYGGLGDAGTYTVPSSHVINAQSVVDARISMSWAATAVSIYDNMLTVDDFLGVSDLLEAANGPFVSVTPQIAVAQADAVFGPWQSFVAGEYAGQYFTFRLAIATSDPTINCVVSAFSVATDVPDRINSGANLAVPAGGATVTYADPFNNTPSVQVTILGASAGDDAVIVKSSTGFTVRILNGGSGVARTIDWIAQGF